MSEMISVEIPTEELDRYGGFSWALCRAVELLKDSNAIKRLTRLMEIIDKKVEEINVAENKRNQIKDLQRDVERLQERLEKL